MNSNGAFILGQSQGMQIISACYADSSGDTPVVAQPADNTIIGMLFNMNDSAQGV
jgi:hypothetical protein